MRALDPYSSVTFTGAPDLTRRFTATLSPRVSASNNSLPDGAATDR